MRLFIAVDFNEQKDFLAGLQNQFNFLDTRLSFTKVFHLTLKFLGEVQPNVADSVMQSLGAVKSRPFTLNLGRIGIFPDSSHMRVVWIGISPEEPVLMLQKAVDESLSSLFKKEKNFKPHITLARVKSVVNKVDFAEHLKYIRVDENMLNVTEFLLVKSELKPDGPLYTVLERFRLAD